MKFVDRAQEAALHRLLRSFPAVLMVGPRQCGKSTLARHALPGWRSIDLERPLDLTLLESDLEGFLIQHPGRLIIDEAQRHPALFPALRHFIDAGKGRGRYLLLGSTSPPLMKGVSESLAGRVGILELTPFSAFELRQSRRASFDRNFWGGFPPVHARRTARERSDWLDAYVTTFIERDVPALAPRLSPARVRTLWLMLTHLHGGLLNVAELSRALGVSSHTVASHLDLLEGAFLIRRLPPFFANLGKRLTKSPKVYLRDAGLLHFLAGLRSAGELAVWPRRGASFEGQVIEEIAQLASRSATRPELFFFRTQAGAEVDLLVKDGRRIVPIEVKAGASVDLRALTGLRQCMADLGLRQGFVVYFGRERREVGHGVTLVPWVEVCAGTERFGFA